MCSALSNIKLIKLKCHLLRKEVFTFFATLSLRNRYATVRILCHCRIDATSDAMRLALENRYVTTVTIYFPCRLSLSACYDDGHFVHVKDMPILL